MNPIRLIIADDHEMIINGLLKYLNNYPEKFQVIGTALDGRELIEIIKKNSPDIVLLDLHMPEINGFEILKIFANDFKNIRTIVISNEYNPRYVTKAIQNGAVSYLKKNINLEILHSAIEKVYETGYFFDDDTSKNILMTIVQQNGSYIIENELYKQREIEILQEICEELTIKQIADKLNISVHTIDHDIRILKEKTKSLSIVGLITFAHKHKINRTREF